MQTSDASTKRHTCFECDTALVGPLCPSCNQIVSSWWDIRGPWPLFFIAGAVIGFGLCKLIF